MLKKFICKGDRAMKWINEPQCNSNKGSVEVWSSECTKNMKSCKIFCIIRLH